MSFISTPLESLEESDLQTLLDNEVLEGKTIDYKEALSVSGIVRISISLCSLVWSILGSVNLEKWSMRVIFGLSFILPDQVCFLLSN